MQHYHAETLTRELLSTAIQLTSRIYSRILKPPSGSEESFAYLLSAGDELRVEMSSNKWPFAKGMCVKAWLHPEQCRSKK